MASPALVTDVPSQVKNAHVHIDCPVVVFTSNEDPADWYPKAGYRTKAALMRRFTHVRFFDRAWSPDQEQESPSIE